MKRPLHYPKSFVGFSYFLFLEALNGASENANLYFSLPFRSNFIYSCGLFIPVYSYMSLDPRGVWGLSFSVCTIDLWFLQLRCLYGGNYLLLGGPLCYQSVYLFCEYCLYRSKLGPLLLLKLQPRRSIHYLPGEPYVHKNGCFAPTWQMPSLLYRFIDWFTRLRFTRAQQNSSWGLEPI